MPGSAKMTDVKKNYFLQILNLFLHLADVYHYSLYIHQYCKRKSSHSYLRDEKLRSVELTQNLRREISRVFK